jgi:hypothetical protein
MRTESESAYEGLRMLYLDAEGHVPLACWIQLPDCVAAGALVQRRHVDAAHGAGLDRLHRAHPNDATAVGFVMALQFGPSLLLLPLTGFAADHFDGGAS